MLCYQSHSYLNGLVELHVPSLLVMDLLQYLVVPPLKHSNPSDRTADDVATSAQDLKSKAKGSNFIGHHSPSVSVLHSTDVPFTEDSISR